MRKKKFKDCEVALRVRGWNSEFPSVQRLLDHLKRKARSEASRIKYLEEIHRFIRYVGVNDPDVLLKKSKKDVEEVIQKFVDELAEKKLSIRYLNTLIADLKLFFRVNGFKNEKEIEVERYYQPARYRKKPEYIPTKEEIFSMAESCGSSLSGLRNKAMILCLYGSGLRNSTLRALRMKDVRKELEAGFDVIQVPVYPEMKTFVPNACKGNIPYFTFFPAEAVEVLRKYLKERKRVYGRIPDEAPLFHTEDRKLKKEKRNLTPLTKDSLAKIIKNAARVAGIGRWKDVYPHCIRKASESFFRGKTTTGIPLDLKIQEFFMGHVLPGSQDAYFDKTKVEELRRAYSTLVFKEKAEETEIATLRMLIESGVLDLSKPSVRAYLFKKLNLEEKYARRVVHGITFDEEGEAKNLITLICEELGVDPKKIQSLMTNDNKADPKIIEERDLERYLAEGWELKAVLPSGKILVGK